MQTCIGLNVEPFALPFGTRLQALAFKANICSWWKGIPVQWFPELLFHLFLRIITINILILIEVVDLSYQIIELGKDHDDEYCKMLFLDLKDGSIATFSCSRRLKEFRFQWK